MINCFMNHHGDRQIGAMKT